MQVRSDSQVDAHADNLDVTPTKSECMSSQMVYLAGAHWCTCWGGIWVIALPISIVALLAAGDPFYPCLCRDTLS